MTFLDWLIFIGLMLIILPRIKELNEWLSGRKNFRD